MAFHIGEWGLKVWDRAFFSSCIARKQTYIDAPPPQLFRKTHFALAMHPPSEKCSIRKALFSRWLMWNHPILSTKNVFMCLSVCVCFDVRGEIMRTQPLSPSPPHTRSMLHSRTPHLWWYDSIEYIIGHGYSTLLHFTTHSKICVRYEAPHISPFWKHPL